MTEVAVQMRFFSLLGVTVSLFFSHLVFAEAFVPNDPLYPQQWNLDKQATGALIDANVAAAWAKGWTGEGVRIGIIELGLFDGTHPDLAENFAPDSNLGGITGASSHATEVAGIAAARGGNGIGVTGAAPYAQLSGLVIDDWAATLGEQYAQAARWRNDAINIKSWSVGNLLSYRYYALTPQFKQAVQETAINGIINVRAAMNYRYNANAFDDKNFFDEIIVGAIGSDGRYADYSDYGSNLTVTAPSGSTGHLGITSATTGNSYASDLSGTSYATPLASGILALVKEAQPNLNVRFAKHLLAKTSRIVDPLDATFFNRPDQPSLIAETSQITPFGAWRTNSAGIHFNNNYGFGLIDADALVDAAQQFVGVTPLSSFSTGSMSVGETIPEDGTLSRTFTLANQGPLEDLTVDFSIYGTYLSSIEMTLTSPAGTVSVLNDAFYATSPGLRQRDWTYLTNSFWGEDPSGTWTLTMRDLPWTPADEMADHVLWNSFGINARFGSLIPAAEGDFDADGDIDGNDYLRWQQNFGSTTNLAADDNHNGVVDAADYVLWRKHFGETSALSTSQAPVPEPTTLVVLLLSSIGSFGARAFSLRPFSK